MKNNLKDTIFKNEDNLKKCKDVFLNLIKVYNERDIEEFFCFTETNIMYYETISKQKKIPIEEAEAIMNFIILVRFWLKEYNRLTNGLKNIMNNITIISKDFLLSEYKINVLKEKNKELSEEIQVCKAVYSDEVALKIIVNNKEQCKDFKKRLEKHIEKLIADKENTFNSLEEAKNVYSIGRFFNKNSEEYKKYSKFLLDKLIDVYLTEAITVAYRDILEYTINILGIDKDIKINFIKISETYRGTMVDTISELLEIIKINQYNIQNNFPIYAYYKGLLNYKHKKMTKAKIKNLNIYNKKTTFTFSEVLEKIIKDTQKEISLHVFGKGVLNDE